MDKPVLFFDGVCGLCNGAVDFVIQNDQKKQFYFSPLQSRYAQSKLSEELTQDLSTLVLIADGKVWTKSLAVLQIFKILGFPWSILVVFKVIPGFLRNFIYDLIARNRYAWFGQKETCRLPTAEERSRFLLEP